MRYGAIEAGGTKFVCAVGSSPDDLVAIERFPTTTPDETLDRAVAFFRAHPYVASVGIGSFGPVDLDPDSSSFGFITSTPKPGWANTDVAGRIGAALGVPVAFDTDVNAAALGEHRWGAAQGVDHVLYLTVGTGIGGGALVRGEPLHGVLHPEMGHVRVPREADDDFGGVCPFHGDCLEGLASGPAMAARWGLPAQELPPDHPAWRQEARYLAQAVSGYILTLAPQRIILGGGVMHQLPLFPLIRRNVQVLLNDYLHFPAVHDEIDRYIVPPGLGDRAGVLGALALAMQASFE